MSDQESLRHQAEAIADSFEVPAVSAARSKGGRGAWITPDERRAIQLAHLTDGLNQSRLAEKFDRTREAIAGCLKGKDFDEIAGRVRDELVAVARNTLAGGVAKAAIGWVRAVDIASAVGNHKPAKELLEATGVVDREPAHHTAVQIIVGMPGSPAGPDPFLGVSISAGPSEPLQ